MTNIQGTDAWVRKWTSRSWPRWLDYLAELGLPASGMVPSRHSCQVHQQQRVKAGLPLLAEPALELQEYGVSTLCLVTLAAHWVHTHKDNVQANAQLFLKRFVNEKQTWAHIDIAGPAYAEKSLNPYTQYGATGYGVATLTHYLEMLAADSE